VQPYIVGSILYGADDLVVEMVRKNIPDMGSRNFSHPVGLGVMRRGQLIGGAVYHDYRERDGDIEMSAAFVSPAWCLPQTLRSLFAYPFVQLGCARMTTMTTRKNKAARAFDERSGFKLEGVLRKAFNRKHDIMIYGMLREECRWIKDKA
jgi:RimJ/RimL family protein N-acetyltransferase